MILTQCLVHARPALRLSVRFSLSSNSVAYRDCLEQETIVLTEIEDVAQEVCSLGRGNDQKGERGRKQEQIMGVNMKSTQFICRKMSNEIHYFVQ